MALKQWECRDWCQALEMQLQDIAVMSRIGDWTSDTSETSIDSVDDLARGHPGHMALQGRRREDGIPASARPGILDKIDDIW